MHGLQDVDKQNLLSWLGTHELQSGWCAGQKYQFWVLFYVHYKPFPSCLSDEIRTDSEYLFMLAWEICKLIL